MNNLLDKIKNKANDIKDLLKILLIDYSNIYRFNKNNYSNIFYISLNGDYSFKELTSEGKKIQSDLVSNYLHYYSILRTLLNKQVILTINEFDKLNNEILIIIQQNQHIHYENIEKAYEKAIEIIDEQLNLILELYNVSSNVDIYLPDTNALFLNQDLTKWRFKNSTQFVILLTPTILSELDKLKIEHRNEDVREKANKIIKQIKGFRQRGSLIKGVNLVNNISTLKSIATEPDFSNTLDWLDEKNNDDRFIASYFEIIRSYPSYNVSIVTGDINLQNKAEFALIPFVEPHNANPSTNKSTPKSINSTA
jgi:hypothetical protein